MRRYQLLFFDRANLIVPHLSSLLAASSYPVFPQFPCRCTGSRTSFWNNNFCRACHTRCILESVPKDWDRTRSPDSSSNLCCHVRSSTNRPCTLIKEVMKMVGWIRWVSIEFNFVTSTVSYLLGTYQNPFHNILRTLHTFHCGRLYRPSLAFPWSPAGSQPSSMLFLFSRPWSMVGQLSSLHRRLKE